MPRLHRSSLLRRLAWLLLFVPWTGVLLAGLAQQQVDPANRALKSQGSQDERNLRALAEVAPNDAVVLVAFTVRGGVSLLPSDRVLLDALRQRLAALPGVVSVGNPKLPDPDLVLMPVSVAGDDVAAIVHAVIGTARAEAPPSLRVLATGLPLVEGTIAQLVAGERAHVVPMLVAVLLFAALLLYRHLGLALAVLLPALAAIAWTGGIVAWLGHPLDPIGSLLDPVLLTIGVAASVHFVEAFRRARGQGLDAAAAADAAATGMRTPALLATAMTMIGLWSLTTSDVPAVVDLGVRAAFGVALAHLFTFLVLPAWLPFAAAGARATAPSEHGAGRRWLRQLRLRGTAFLLLTTAVTALAIGGIPWLHPDNDPLRLLPAKDQVLLDHDELADRLGGVETFHLLVPARSAGSEPSRLLPFVAAMRQQAGVTGLAGPVLRGPEGDLAVPLLLQPGGSAIRDPLFAAVDRAARVLGLDGTVSAGASVQIARDSHELMHGLFGSLGLSFALLAIGMCIGLRSVRLGLLGMLPNLLPSAWVYGALGWSEHPVSVATAMTGCTMLGLIVDNTMHLLHHYRNARATMAARPALRASFDHCGRAMTLSSIVLALGFLVATTSRLSTTVEFAWLATSKVAAAWFGVAVVLPLLLMLRNAPRPAMANGTE
ncbi:MAG TPA: MMPL family transporter [Planctomycetota bacterium]|nr:MMPL family transporter [Planctomycetota bacterium]